MDMSYKVRPSEPDFSCVEENVLLPPKLVEFTWYLSLKDKSFMDAFDDYRVKEFPLIPKLIVTAFVSLYALVLFAQTVTLDSNDRDPAIFFLLLIGLLRPAIFCSYTYISCQEKFNFKRKMSFPARYFGNSALVLTSLVTGLILTRLVLQERCSGDRISNCNEADERSIPLFPVFHLVIGQILCVVVFRCHDLWATSFSFVTTFACILVTLQEVNAPLTDVLRLILLLLTVAFVTYEFEHTVAHSFTSYANLEQVTRERVTAENEKKIIAENAKDLRHFIGNVAHDLKTPLQAFVSELDCLEGSGQISSREGQSSLSSLKSTCHFMTMTINRSLDFVKSTSGFKLQPKAETVDINYCFGWVRECIYQCARRNMKLLIEDLAPNVCRHIITDKQWLMENLLCLASNAVKYIGDGGEVRFTVTLESRKVLTNNEIVNKPLSGSEVLRFEVEDDGVGISQAKMASLFQPFKQAQRNAGGTGLGLFALANRSLAIGGEYGVSNRRDGQSGVLFWFTIPYRPDGTVAILDGPSSRADDLLEISECSESLAPSLSGEGAAPGLKAATSSGVQILLVEDSLLIQKTTTRLLRNIGHSIDVANHGMECLQRIREKQYDLILMDINMPVMDGLETIQRIRGDETASRIESHCENMRKQFVIGISADSDTETRDTALRAGMNDFLDKPLDISTLKKKCLAHGLKL